MIDVPVLVKDALRDGRRLKNYKFRISQQVVTHHVNYETIGVMDLNDEYVYYIYSDGDYRLYNASANAAVTIEINNGSVISKTFPAIPGATTTEIIINLSAGSEITLVSSSIPLELQMTIETDDSEWQYRFTIDNDSLVKESVDFDERMCSGDTIKFGLCEGTSLEFQYFNKPNINGNRIEAFIEVLSDYYEEYDPEWHNVATVLDNDETFVIENAGTYKLGWSGERSVNLTWTTNGSSHSDTIIPTSGDQTFNLGDMVKGDYLRITSDNQIQTFELKGYYSERNYWYTIPLGFYEVKKCARQASTGIMKVTAYNKLQSDYLDANGNELIDELLGGSGSYISLYDIQKNLLADYQIGLEESHVPRYGFSGSLFTSGISQTFKKKTFANGSETSPINIQMMGGSATSTSSFTFSFGSTLYRWLLDPDLEYDIATIKNIDQLEEKYFSYLSDGISKSGVSNPSSFISAMTKTVTTAFTMSVSGFPSGVKGWANLFSVVLVKRNGSWEWYSKIGKDNKLANCKGSIGDLSHLIIRDCTYLFFVYAGNISKGVSSGSDLATPIWYLFQNQHFTYYDTNREVRTAIYPRILDLNGQPFNGYDLITVDNITNLSNANKILLNTDNLPKFTLRDIVNASYETVCQFGKLDRVTDLFSGVELNNSRLFPAVGLYPAETLYPDGAAVSSEKSMYSKLWADEGNIQKWRNLIITYKGLDEQQNEKDFTLQRQVNADGTQDYNMSDNWVFRNLVWTAEQVGEYADAMVVKMRNITWFPFELWGAGLPYLETGDEIEVTIGQTTYTSYVLQRRLKGIQNLQDTYINGTLDIF